jgi:2-polyprenyl-6-methoxyphenol hydroxylase-like FAD-dependent oxidoreductase
MDTADSVIVAGGGIGGLAVANALLDKGVPVVVLEQAERLQEIGAAIGVQTNAVRALRGMVLADAVIANGVPIEYYEYYSWRGHRLVQWSQGMIGRRIGEPTVVIHRGDLQRVLLDRPRRAGVLRLGGHVVGYTEDATGVEVELGDGSRVRGTVLIGADGLRSTVRCQLLGPDPLRYSGWVAYRGIARFADSRFPLGYARQTLGRGCSFGMWHLPGGRVYWVATLTEPAGGDVPTGRRRDRVLEVFGRGHPPIRDLVRATAEDAVLRNEVYDRLPVPSWSSGRVVLLGDAAHPTTPVTGQGGGQAIIDAAVLGAELAGADLHDPAQVTAAFAAYERRRRAVTSAITTEAWRISKLHHLRNPVATTGRNLSLRLTPARVWNRRMEQRLAF